MSEVSTSDGRSRSYAVALYPESLPDDFLSRIDDLHIACFLSPLHDRDIDPSSDELKKPHYHLLLLFDGKKSALQVVQYMEEVGLPVKYAEPVRSARAYARYLCHLDSGDVPEKRIYPVSDVRSFGGAIYSDYVQNDKSNAYALREMIQFIEDNEIYSYKALLLSLLDRPYWLSLLNTPIGTNIREYIRSKKDLAH